MTRAVFQIVMTLRSCDACTACAAARARSKSKVRGIGLAWGEGAPFPVARRADSHCTCCAAARKRSPRSLAHHDVWTAPPHPRPRQDSKPALHRASRAARSARRLRHPHHQEATRASYRGEHVGAWARSAHATAPSAQREAATGLPKAPGPGAQHALGAERVARGARGAALAEPAVPQCVH